MMLEAKVGTDSSSSLEGLVQANTVLSKRFDYLICRLLCIAAGKSKKSFHKFQTPAATRFKTPF